MGVEKPADDKPNDVRVTDDGVLEYYDGTTRSWVPYASPPEGPVLHPEALPVAAEAIPQQGMPEEAVPDEAVPDEAVPDEAVPDEAVGDA